MWVETIDSSLSIFALPHLGQTGCVEPLTSNSDSFPHSWQAYSYSGMRRFLIATSDPWGAGGFR